jgi:carbon monoxide dehydrogenase subunit G
MPSLNYTTNMTVPRDRVWVFVRDINNWASLVKGYQGHELIGERESIWTVKGELGPVTRITKVRITVTEWVDGERVAFAVKGLNEPITGEGSITVRDAGTGTEISGTGNIQFGGALAPMVNRLIAPFVESVADDLVTKIVATVQGGPLAAAAGAPGAAGWRGALKRLYARIARWVRARFSAGRTPSDVREETGATYAIPQMGSLPAPPAPQPGSWPPPAQGEPVRQSDQVLVGGLLTIGGTYTLEGPRERVWSLLMDPDVLRRCLPGCEQLEVVGDHAYEGVLKVGVAAVRGTYAGKVRLQDIEPPRRCTMVVEGGGPPGSVCGRGVLDLEPQGSGTLLNVRGEAEVSGLIASVGHRLLGGVGKMMLGQFVKTLAQQIASPPGAVTTSSGGEAPVQDARPIVR